MKNRPIFIKVKNFIEAQGYTIEQVQNVTDEQVRSLLNLTGDEYEKYKQYAVGIKTILIRNLREIEDVQTLADLKSQINTWPLARFPDYEIEKDFSDKANRKVTFYLDGRK